MSPGTARVRTRSSPSTQQQQQNYRRSYSSIQADKLQTSSEFSSKNSTEMSQDGELEAEKLCGNRVMVVIDSSIEAKAALHWALSHTVQSRDTVILLHVVTRPSVQGGNNNIDHRVNQRSYKLLSSMKNLCQVHKPGVQVEILVKEGKEKGSTIVEEAKHEKVSLLVLGKRKRSIVWLVQKMWAGNRRRIRSSSSSSCSATDYCVQNAKCMTVAVRKKGRNHGGYLITTKRHKDFWLLA